MITRILPYRSRVPPGSLEAIQTPWTIYWHEFWEDGGIQRMLIKSIRTSGTMDFGVLITPFYQPELDAGSKLVQNHRVISLCHCTHPPPAPKKVRLRNLDLRTGFAGRDLVLWLSKHVQDWAPDPNQSSSCLGREGISRAMAPTDI